VTGKQTDLAALQQGYQAEQHQQVRGEKDRLLTDVATQRQQIEELGKNQLRLDEEIVRFKRLQEDVIAKQAEIASCEETEKLVKFLRNQVFKNVSAQLSERFREEISLRADRIYRTIAESDEELYWGDNYQIVLKDMHDGTVRERSDDQLSGGQMMSAVVALRLALLQTIGARIAFFDEPTSNLDAARRKNLAQAFRSIDVGREEVTEHWYDQLFLVSHDVAFTEITDQMIQVGE
jgi:exonuclease SbcC